MEQLSEFCLCLETPHEEFSSSFFDETGLELHRSNTVHLAINIMIAFYQADVFDLGANLYDR